MLPLTQRDLDELMWDRSEWRERAEKAEEENQKLRAMLREVRHYEKIDMLIASRIDELLKEKTK